MTKIKNGTKQGFSLAEALITLLIVLTAVGLKIMLDILK